MPGAALAAAVILVVEFDLVAGNLGAHGPATSAPYWLSSPSDSFAPVINERGADDDRIALGDLDASKLVCVAVGGTAGRRRSLRGVLALPAGRSLLPPLSALQAARTSISTTSRPLHRMYFCIRLTSSTGLLGGSRMRGPGVTSARHHTGA